MSTLVSCGLQWELHQREEFGPTDRIRLYQSQSTRTPTAASVTHFPSAAFRETHQSEHEKMHFSQNCHYLFFLSIVISPLRIYCGQERFWVELVELEKLWICWFFFLLFLILYFSVHLKIQMLLLKSFIWPNGLENQMKVPIFLGPVLKHTNYTIAALLIPSCFYCCLQMKLWHDGKQKKKMCQGFFVIALKGLVGLAVVELC